MVVSNIRFVKPIPFLGTNHSTCKQSFKPKLQTNVPVNNCHLKVVLDSYYNNYILCNYYYSMYGKCSHIICTRPVPYCCINICEHNNYCAFSLREALSL